MAYIGRDIEYGVLEKQSLTADSSTVAFDLNYSANANGLIVSVGGIVQEPNVAYTVVGNTLTFAAAPLTGDAVYVVYLGEELMVSIVKPLDYIDYQVGTGDGSDTTPIATLNHSVSLAQDIMVTLNGVRQVPGTDYSVSGTTLTFTTAPANGEAILVYFLMAERAEGEILDNSITNEKIVGMNASKITGSVPVNMVSNSSIVSMDASKLTGSLPSVYQPALYPQYQDLSTIALHWASVNNKVAMNLTDDFIDHFQDDTGWIAYNGYTTTVTTTTPSSSSDWAAPSGDPAGSIAGNTFSSGRLYYSNGGDEALRSATTVSGDFEFQVTVTEGQTAGAWVSVFDASEIGTFTHHETGNVHSMNNAYYYAAISRALQTPGFTARTGGSATNTAYSSANGDVVKITREGSTIKNYLNGTLKATATGVPTGEMYICLGGGGGSASVDSDYTSITWTTTVTATTPETNTGSENVSRLADEYVATVYSTTSSSTAYPYASNDEVYYFGGTSPKDGATNSALSSGITSWTSEENFYNTDNNDAAWFWPSPSTSYNTWFYIDYLTQLKNIRALGLSKICYYGLIRQFRISYSDDATNWTNVDFTGSTATQLAPNVTLDIAAINNAGGVLDFTNTTGNAVLKSGAKMTLAESSVFDARYIRFELGTWQSGTNASVGMAHLIPYCDLSSSTANATGKLISTTSTADSTVSKATGVMLYKDGIGTNTLGTDLKTYFSADDGANWTEAASYGTPITFDGTTKAVPLGETTMSNTGTQVKMKAEWANQAATIPASGTEKSITPAGGVSYSSTIVKIGNSSIRHTSSNGVLNIADHDDWDFGSNFTVEGWFRFDDLSNKKNIIAHNGGSNSWANINFYMQTDTNNVIQVGCGNAGGSGVSVDSTTQVSVDTWYHIAMIKEGNTLSVAINGTIENSATGTMAPNTGVTNPLWVGSGGAGGNLEGYSDEIRVSDVARYTADFTPSTTAFTSDANTLLLIHSNTTDDGVTFVDSSSNTHTVTTAGNIKHSISQSKIDNSSIYSTDTDGAGLTVDASDASWDSGTNNFTWEAWIRTVDKTKTQEIISFYGSGGGELGENTLMRIHGGSIKAKIGGQVLVATETINNNTWHHICFERTSATQFYLYVDGVGTASSGFSSHSIATNSVTIANHKVDGGDNTENFDGYIDEVRISNVARYNGTNFTPSTTAFISDSDTQLLIHSDDYSTTFTDSSSKGHTITPESGNKHQPSIKKIGDSSISFGGVSSGDYITAAAHNDIQALFDGRDFTIEYWVKLKVGGGASANNFCHVSNEHYVGPYLFYQHVTSGSVAAYMSTTGATWDIANDTAVGTITDTNWHHLAVSRDGSNIRMFLDGVLGNTISHSGSIWTPNQGISFGAAFNDNTTPNTELNGYMDEIRVSDNARYTSAFTPSTTAFTSDANTILLIHGDSLNPQTQIGQGVGTVFGNMTSSGGADAKAFDGTRIASAPNIAATPGATVNAYIGKDWGEGVTKTVSGVKIWGSSNEGYCGGGGTSTIKLMGSNSLPTSASDGTELGAFADISDSNSSNPQEKMGGFITTTAYRYHWLWNAYTNNDQAFFAEVEFYEGDTFTDDSVVPEVIGKSAQLHGWAVNY